MAIDRLVLLVKAYRVVLARAERGLDLDTFLRMQRDAHEAMQPTRDEEKKDERPIRPVFDSAARPATPASPGVDDGGTTPAETPQPPPPLTVDGQVYE